MLYPASIAGWTDDIAAESKRAASWPLTSLVAATGATQPRLSARSDLTGFNWSDVPVILPEIGLMTNRAEDALLATDGLSGQDRPRTYRGHTELPWSELDYAGVSKQAYRGG